jgi:translocation and assembly module TamB
VSESAARPRRWRMYALIVVGAGLGAVIAGLWYVTTNSFQTYVRERTVGELERITGGRVQVGSFHVVPFHMQVELRDITIRGSEAPGDIPLAHADHLLAHVKVISFLRTEFGFHSVNLEHPVVHIAIASDGSTNVPALKEMPTPGNSPFTQLFALSIDHLSVHDGELLWADRKIPLDFDVQGTGLQMDYSYLRGRYEGQLTIAKVDTAFEDFRPFSWMTALRFSLGPTFADIESLQWSSGRSHLEGDGRISDFRNPHIDGNYDAHFDLGEIAAIARRRDLQEGSAEFKGSGRWTLNDFGASGTVAVRDLGWQDQQMVLKKANASADYSVTDQQIKLSKLQGLVLGGSFAGDAQVDNWLHSVPLPPFSNVSRKGTENLPMITAVRPPAKKGEKTKTSGVQVGLVRLRVRDVSAGELAAALDVPAHPLHHFHPAGFATGTVDANWKGSANDTEIAFALEVNPPAHPAAGELPMTAHIAGKYRYASDALELAKFDLSTPATRIHAAGVLSASSTLHLSVSTSNLEEWQPLVTALGGPAALPFRVDDNAAFNGVAGGSVSEPTLAGTVTAQDFEFTLPATSRTPAQPVHWDSLAASIQFSSHELALRGGTLRRGDTSADFDVTAFLQEGHFTENTQYNAHVNMHNVDVAATAAFAGFDYPVTGRADVSLQLAGTRAQPQVEGHIHAANASAYGESIERFDADLNMADGETALNNIQLAHQDATVTGSAAYTPDTRGMKLDLVGKNFNLAQVRQIQLKELPVEGRADFTLRGTGTLDAPVLNAGVHVRDLTFDGELSGGLDLEAVSEGNALHVSGHSEFLHGTLSLDGSVQMSGDYPARITARTDHVDLDALWRSYLGEQLTGHSSVVGTITMNGPLRYPKQWTLDGEATDLSLEVEYAKLHNQGPVRFTYAQRIAHIEPSHFIGEGTDVTGQGTIGFAGTRELDLTADGQMDLKFFDSLDKDLTAAGLMTVHMKLSGTLDEPHPHGSIQVKDGTANYAGMPSGLSEINGSMTFSRNGVHIDTLTARTGGGTLDFKGDATIFNQQLSFNLTTVGKDVRLRYPPGVSSTANAELHWVGTRQASTVSGQIMVTKLAVTPGFDFGSYLQQSRQTAGITPANSPLYNVKLDVAVNTAPELQMKTAVARLSGDAALRLRGSFARPSVLGRADILEGDATFNGIKFRLERGDITFANPVAIEPQVNLQASTHVRNYDLDVTVTGTPERLNVNYRSEPPLPKSDIIALLALGRTSEESEQLQQQSGQTLFTDEASAMIINQAINSTVSSRMQKLFGASRIKIDPQGLTTETNPIAKGPQITIEQEFANNISLTYSTNVSQSTEQIIEGEYYFTRNVSVVGIRDWNGVVSFDVRVRRFKK